MAVEESNNADAAEKMAKEVSDEAKKSSDNLGTIAVGGDSGKATTNALEVMGARAKIESALTAAKKAEEELNDALTKLNAKAEDEADKLRRNNSKKRSMRSY